MMKTTLSLIVLLTAILGFALVGNALAQPFDGGSSLEEVAPATPELAAQDAGAGATTVTPLTEAVPAPDKPIDQGQGLYRSVKGGHWLLAFGFFGMILGSMARFSIGKKWAFLKTKAGGYTIAGFTGMGILGGLIVEAGAFSISMLPTAFMGMLAAMALHGPAKAVVGKLTSA